MVEPRKSTPAPIQVVFQGGGAKLCLLMAVCEVLRKYEVDQLIEIKRVAGSSAGAIASVMLASSKEIQTYKAELKLLAEQSLLRMETAPWRGAWRVFRGDAYFKGFNLENFFKELFCKNGGPQKLSDLRVKGTKVYFTDLYSLAPLPALDDEGIPRALAKSCRFPFAFAGYNSGTSEVDGGLALNLPVDLLNNEQNKYGPVIAIGFMNRFADIKEDNLLTWTSQLFSAAIQSGVARSEATLGKQNVFGIDTDIATFDFRRALNEGLDTQYKLVVSTFDTWLSNWLKSHGPIDSIDFAQQHKLVCPNSVRHALDACDSARIG